nr:uncharacterized protein LOC111421376 [Onthophagus taurus]
MHFGLTYQNIRALAYECAVKLEKKHPPSWDTSKMAGEDWLAAFMKRNQNLSHRKPENTSLAKANAFNPTNVKQFFDNYRKLMEKYNFTPDQILNCDETGITTVVQAPKVLSAAQSGKKQVGQVVSGECDTLLTFCGIIAVSGVSLQEA